MGGRGGGALTRSLRVWRKRPAAAHSARSASEASSSSTTCLSVPLAPFPCSKHRQMRRMLLRAFSLP
jgi:hypothetical protein